MSHQRTLLDTCPSPADSRSMACEAAGAQNRGSSAWAGLVQPEKRHPWGSTTGCRQMGRIWGRGDGWAPPRQLLSAPHHGVGEQTSSPGRLSIAMATGRALPGGQASPDVVATCSTGRNQDAGPGFGGIWGHASVCKHVHVCLGACMGVQPGVGMQVHAQMPASVCMHIGEFTCPPPRGGSFGSVAPSGQGVPHCSWVWAGRAALNHGSSGFLLKAVGSALCLWGR